LSESSAQVIHSLERLWAKTVLARNQVHQWGEWLLQIHGRIGDFLPGDGLPILNNMAGAGMNNPQHSITSISGYQDQDQNHPAPRQPSIYSDATAEPHALSSHYSHESHSSVDLNNGNNGPAPPTNRSLDQNAVMAPLQRGHTPHGTVDPSYYASSLEGSTFGESQVSHIGQRASANNSVSYSMANLSQTGAQIPSQPLDFLVPGSQLTHTGGSYGFTPKDVTSNASRNSLSNEASKIVSSFLTKPRKTRRGSVGSVVDY